MSDAGNNSSQPRSKRVIADSDFIPHRAKVLDIAAFLDRLDRAPGDDDFRLRALREALTLLQDGKPERARRILELWSDRSSDPIAKAPMKGAVGCVDLSATAKRDTAGCVDHAAPPRKGAQD